MALPVLSQSAFDLELRWWQGDPVSLSWVVLDVDWSGTYTAGVYNGDTLLTALTISATYSAVTGNTTFTATLSDANSDLVAAGLWSWKCREAAGLTRFAGAVRVNG